MRDLEVLSDCFVKGGEIAEAPARSRRRGAFVLSVLLQSALLAALLILPILSPSAMRARYSFVPLPPYHGGGANQANPRHTSRPARDSFPTQHALYQPLSIPHEVSNSAQAGEFSGGPPDVGYGTNSDGGPGVDFGTGNSIFAAIAPPPKPPQPPLVVRQSEGVQAAQLITRIEPIYPPAALAMHMSGTVRLKAIIAMDGTVKQLDVLSGNPILARSALDAVRRWRYRPTLLNNQPVEVETDITVIFQLTN